ncbi:hypothetical protein [Mongoliibacter ruber]|uniref:Uncharacterized protein n=1 Tax=Mongoliibacter ruber TaxID=1750599 RepID=A0A2T0WVR5_9BACT|nr:hypothetical protein [Mongoliibacter ruber]PRY90684.1 hypothetical protein CLW00_101349 [Mongoliibacter ruber]
MKKNLLIALLSTTIFLYAKNSKGQADDFKAVKAKVDFKDKLREWDGFGFNYVETAQTYDHNKNPQDYGGFKYLNETAKNEIIELVFGEEGLRPSLIKMFLDPLHQAEENGAYDHKTTTQNMRYFVKAGLEKSKKRNESLQIITTLYAPPAYITNQKVMRGRDLDPDKIGHLANYLINWVKFLKEENLPVSHVSIHNEGESWLRWPEDGTTGGALDEGHDYNFFWNPEQTLEFIKFLRPKMDNSGLQDIGITNGEYTNWYRFYHWGFAKALASDQKALDNLSLVTSHGFYVGPVQSGRWHGPHSNLGIDLIREKRPELKSWVTSTAWNVFEMIDGNRTGIMDSHFIKEIHGNIYEAKVNGIIPWAGIQNHVEWWKPDPNPGTAIRTFKDGTYEVPKAYYFYKQVSRAGKPGMDIVYTEAMDSEFSLIGFAPGSTAHPGALVITHTGKEDRWINVDMMGTNEVIKAYRTTGSETYFQKETARTEPLSGDNHLEIDSYKMENNTLIYKAPAGSVTTFYLNLKQ